MSLPFTHQPFQEIQFDIFEWYPRFQSCLRFFLDHGQHTESVQAVAAFINIRLPYQKTTPRATVAAAPSTTTAPSSSDPSVTLVIPYIRRLVATAFDSPAVLHGFFGDEWTEGVGPIHDSERRNYLFAAKSDSWLAVKSHYDMDDEQTIPFLRPLQNVSLAEIEGAETGWSDWLAMQDWMLGPRSLNPDDGMK
ncbi:Conserved hypothetical, protein [Geosmithia morbida]|uniref:Conserved hypothetical, protein n=1 Tax=Geosmithia morbida TaxID=1094350 RepID=A0A9P4YQY9_9HYPO|nr:Conserved hypothetical, protein [Geosmithia morbida]KAF4120159.1 Conserved hypothetical, protein [Geosmithia morbida]